MFKSHEIFRKVLMATIVLKGIDFEINKGEVVAILGHQVQAKPLFYAV